MNYEECAKKIRRFLKKDDYQPLIVDVQNREDLSKLLAEFCPMTPEAPKSIPVSQYSDMDEFPRIENLLHDLQTKAYDCFVTGLSSYLRLMGEEKLTAQLNEILHMSTMGHMVIITYQCKRFFNVRDPRLERRLALLDGNLATIPEIFFVRRLSRFQKT